MKKDFARTVIIEVVVVLMKAILVRVAGIVITVINCSYKSYA